MKKVFLTVAICFAGLATFAQSRPLGSELSIGAEAALPVGDLKNVTNFGFGATLKYAYNFDETIAVTLQSGYIYFPGKDLGAGNKVNLSQIPLKAGVRYSINQFYIEPQLGVGFWHGSATGQTLSMLGVNGSDNTTMFTYGGGIGVLASRNFDIGFRFEGASKDGAKYNFLGLRLAYVFPLK